MQICSAKIIAETDKFFYKKYNYKLAEQYRDIVNIGLHFFHKDVRLYAASCSEV